MVLFPAGKSVSVPGSGTETGFRAAFIRGYAGWIESQSWTLLFGADTVELIFGGSVGFESDVTVGGGSGEEFSPGLEIGGLFEDVGRVGGKVERVGDAVVGEEFGRAQGGGRIKVKPVE